MKHESSMWKIKEPVSKQVCPVCNGKGLVPYDFYEVDNRDKRYYTARELTPKQCRTCNGRGII